MDENKQEYNELDKKVNYEKCKKNQDYYQIGIKSNFKKYNEEEAKKFGRVNTEDIYEFEHFNIQLPKMSRLL